MDSKIILISGASRGIGKQTAIELTKCGYTVIADYNKSEQSAKELQKEYNIDIFKADISNSSEIKKLTDYVLNKYKKIDVLINNAGISQTKMFTDITDDDWNLMINTNLYSCFKLTQNCLPNMIHNKSGCIINISSMWGQVGASCESLYSITKAGIDAMTKSLAKELGPSGIRVNSIAPGFIDTDMINNMWIIFFNFHYLIFFYNFLILLLANMLLFYIQPILFFYSIYMTFLIVLQNLLILVHHLILLVLETLFLMGIHNFFHHCYPIHLFHF